MVQRACPAHGSNVALSLVLFIALFSMSACGRIGMQSIPTSGGDAGPSEDSGSDACATRCENPNGAAECSEGQCILTCATGYADCDSQSDNGCETALSTTVDDCGSCGGLCTNDHGETMCSEGLCSPACTSGHADCDGDAANGCESSLLGTAHCGACGVSCSNAHGTTRCDDGSCSPSCDDGFADCDGLSQNGCETNVASDPQHCGACTTSCNPASQICVAGTCETSPCSAGLGECDADPTLACETDLETSLEHCGFCGNACAVANGTAECAAGSCLVAGCEGSFGDCDGLASSGCETPLSSTTDHCGACGSGCMNPHGSTSCADSTCQPACSSGYGDCDSSRPNGCETTLDTIDHCGSCGMVCPANGGTPVCNAGVCGTVCDLSGTFALKLTVPTTWPSSTTIAAGSGTFTYWALLEWTQSGTSLTGSVKPCGEVVPDFSMVPPLSEDYGVTYAASVYDTTPLPSTGTSGSLGGTGPGSSFTLAPSALMLGVELSDPVNDAWPSQNTLLSMNLHRDADADGKPGLSGAYKSGGGYSQIPVNTFASTRARTGYIATRVVFSLSGTLTSCTQSSGSASAQDIDNHTLGCRISTDSRDCNGTEADHLDSNTPNFQTQPSSYSLLKIAAGAACSDVGAALP